MYKHFRHKYWENLFDFVYVSSTTVQTRVQCNENSTRSYENLSVSKLVKTAINTVIIHSRALNQSVIVERVTCRSNMLRYWTGTYWTVANRGFFSWFFNPFQMFCQCQTYDKQYDRIMKRIWDIIIQFFLPVLFKIIKARENLSSRNSFVCNSLAVSNITFSLKLGQTYMELSLFMHTYL
jgi:hypothetical protein